jgi:hypothetical protein
VARGGGLRARGAIAYGSDKCQAVSPSSNAARAVRHRGVVLGEVGRMAAAGPSNTGCRPPGVIVP